MINYVNKVDYINNLLVRIISNYAKKTADMVKYEKLTGKHAVWRGTVTKGYKKWKMGEKEYYLNQKRITFYVPETLKEHWKIFAKENDYITLSNLRPSVKSISIRLPEIMVEELKLLAHKKDIPYQSLMKIYISEKVEEELQKI